MTDDSIRCPWCAEEILAAAKKCKHCGEFLTDEVPAAASHSSTPAVASPAVASVGDHQCPTCLATLGSSRDLYLHRANAHGYKASQPTGRVTQPTGDQAITCPQCGLQGRVTTRSVKVKKGISGGKATAAVLTMGFSMLGTGLSRKEKVTEARCGQCKSTWHF